jgi:integrase
MNKTIPYSEVKQRISNIPIIKHRLYFAILYANGNRASEPLILTLNDISWNEKFIYITTIVLKKRGIAKGKIKRNPPISRIKESWLTEIIINCTEELKKNFNPEEPIFDWTMRTSQRKCWKYFGCKIHTLRHTRVTHCFTILRMSLNQVIKYFEISQREAVRWSMIYGHLENKDLEEHLSFLEQQENLGGV